MSFRVHLKFNIELTTCFQQFVSKLECPFCWNFSNFQVLELLNLLSPETCWSQDSLNNADLTDFFTTTSTSIPFEKITEKIGEPIIGF